MRCHAFPLRYLVRSERCSGGRTRAGSSPGAFVASDGTARAPAPLGLRCWVVTRRARWSGGVFPPRLAAGYPQQRYLMDSLPTDPITPLRHAMSGPTTARNSAVRDPVSEQQSAIRHQSVINLGALGGQRNTALCAAACDDRPMRTPLGGRRRVRPLAGPGSAAQLETFAAGGLRWYSSVTFGARSRRRPPTAAARLVQRSLDWVPAAGCVQRVLALGSQGLRAPPVCRTLRLQSTSA